MKLISKSELSQRWDCTPGYIQSLMKKGLLPFMKFGYKLIRFRLSDVLSYEEKTLHNVTADKPTQILGTKGTQLVPTKAS